MLELIRKQQKWILIIVAVIIFFAFAWWGDFFGRGEQNPGRGQAFISFGGKTYTQAQISKVASGYQVAQRHFPFHVFQVERAYRKYELAGLDYALNTLALRQHAVDYGIAVSPAEIDKRMLSMPDFQTPEARNRIYRIYGSLGLGEGDVAQIVADVITMEKLSDLVSAGLLASEAGAEFDYAARYQTIFSSVTTIPDVNPEDVEITEEELKDLYETQKAGLQTERKVAIRYVFFEAPSEKAPKESDPAPGEKEKPTDPEKPVEAEGEDGKEAKEAKENAGETKVGEDAKTDGGKSVEEPKSGESNAPEEDSGVDCEGDGESADVGSDPEAPRADPTVENSEDVGEPKPTAPEGKEKEETVTPPSGDAKPITPPVSPGTGGNKEEVPEKPAEKEGAVPPVGVPGIEIPEIEIPKIDIPEEEELLSFEERARLRKEFNALVDQFWGEFYKEGQFVPGVSFAEMAKDPRYKLEVVETELFSQSDPPEGIADQRELIANAVTKSLDPPISDPIPATGEKRGYYIFEILKVEEPRQKTFEESKEVLEKALRRDKAAEATLVAADKAREKLVAAMEAGKSFEEAATEAGLIVEEIKPFSPSEPPAEPANLRQLLPALMATVPGEVSEVVDLFEGKALVVVSKRELWKRANAESLKDGVRSGAISSQGFSLLGDWFATVRNQWNEKIL